MNAPAPCRHCGFPATPEEVCPAAPWDPAQGRPSGQAAEPIPPRVRGRRAGAAPRMATVGGWAMSTAAAKRAPDVRRRPFDFYETNPADVRPFLRACPLPGGRWLGCSVGRGSMIRAAGRTDVQWTGVDIRDEVRADVERLGARFVAGDFLVRAAGLVVEHGLFDVCFDNPPHKGALPLLFAQAALAISRQVAFLLPLAKLAGKKRNAWMREHHPDVYVLPERPSFTGDAGTAMEEYGWFHWPTQAPRHEGRLVVLPVEEHVGQGELFGGAP